MLRALAGEHGHTRNIPTNTRTSKALTDGHSRSQSLERGALGRTKTQETLAVENGFRKRPRKVTQEAAFVSTGGDRPCAFFFFIYFFFFVRLVHASRVSTCSCALCVSVFVSVLCLSLFVVARLCVRAFLAPLLCRNFDCVIF